ncbi:MAG: hydroxyisourate hydrolase [Deltaproteobacteria bacterium]|nr:hydroxyisourate hydrolase [Deltaproteobacteria bacterium]MBU53302.1 hydroxyisourate hydrolase [Deltaproteobacteria bacterium]
MKSPITTHVLDTMTGSPAAGLAIKLLQKQDEQYVQLASGYTNNDGRIVDLLEPGSLTPGIYQMHFDTGEYHHAAGLKGFYPEAVITFEVVSTDEHYHIPLLLSPFGYSTYRGS